MPERPKAVTRQREWRRKSVRRSPVVERLESRAKRAANQWSVAFSAWKAGEMSYGDYLRSRQRAIAAETAGLPPAEAAMVAARARGIYDLLYRQTPDQKARIQQYSASEKMRAARERWKESEAGIASSKARSKSPERRAYQRGWARKRRAELGFRARQAEAQRRYSRTEKGRTKHRLKSRMEQFLNSIYKISSAYVGLGNAGAERARRRAVSAAVKFVDGTDPRTRALSQGELKILRQMLRTRITNLGKKLQSTEIIRKRNAAIMLLDAIDELGKGRNK